MANNHSKILFIINPGSGKKRLDWPTLIRDFFIDQPVEIDIYEMPNPCHNDLIRERIEKSAPEKVVAVGGDGTIKLVAECLRDTSTPMGILPAGSANGMARELGISLDPEPAMQTLLDGITKDIHLIQVNDELCIHLSDIGFNAYVIKKFEDNDTRGMWGYVKAAWKVLWSHSRMKVKLQIDERFIHREAVMVVIANATMYGNGVVINPRGTLYDDLFEVVIIKKISFVEIFKMRFTQKNFNPRKTELFQTHSLNIQSRHSVHFQVDGETMGKVNAVEATILPHALKVIIPAAEK